MFCSTSNPVTQIYYLGLLEHWLKQKCSSFMLLTGQLQPLDLWGNLVKFLEYYTVLHTYHYWTNKKNIARVAKCCPENKTLVVKSFKLLFSKVLNKKTFIFYSCDSGDSSDSNENNHATFPQKILHFFFLNLISTFGKSNLTHLTTDVMFSGQRFAILAMFCWEVAWFLFVQVAQFSLTRVCIFFLERLRDFLVERLRDVFVWRGVVTVVTVVLVMTVVTKKTVLIKKLFHQNVFCQKKFTKKNCEGFF